MCGTPVVRQSSVAGAVDPTSQTDVTHRMGDATKRRGDVIRMNSRGEISDEKISALEAKLTHTLPSDYREFLKRTNGGIPEPYEHPNEDVWVTMFLGIDVEQSLDNLAAFVVDIGSRFPTGILPIAHSEGGNLICISLRAHDYGCIYFWDHELESDEGYFDENLTRLATDFNTFLADLTP